MTASFAASAALASAALAAGAPLVVEAEGGLWRDGTALPGAASLLARHAGRCAIVSNDARATAGQFAARLAGAGLPAAPGQVLTAGAALVAVAATRWPGARVLLLAPRELVAAARALGLEPASDGAAAVLLADDTELSAARLCAAAAALAAGVPCLAASAEPRGPDGAPGPGALLAALLVSVPRATIEVLGLPNTALLRHALARTGSAGADAVLVAAPHRAEAAAAAGLRFLPAERALAAFAAPTLNG